VQLFGHLVPRLVRPPHYQPQLQPQPQQQPPPPPPQQQLSEERWIVFSDLGSGTGKMATQVALDYGRHSMGVELSETRHRAGVLALEEGVSCGWISAAERARIELQHGDLTHADLSRCHVVYLANVRTAPPTFPCTHFLAWL
jgi:hypothetical protein